MKAITIAMLLGFSLRAAAQSPLKDLGAITIQPAEPAAATWITDHCGSVQAGAPVTLSFTVGAHRVRASLTRGSTALWTGDASSDWPSTPWLTENLIQHVVLKFAAAYPGCTTIYVDPAASADLTAQLAQEGYHLMPDVHRADFSLRFIDHPSIAHPTDYHQYCYWGGDGGSCSDNLGDSTSWTAYGSTTTVTDNTTPIAYTREQKGWMLYRGEQPLFSKLRKRIKTRDIEKAIDASRK